MSSAEDDISELSTVLPVSRETSERLETYVALVRKWQQRDNLISAATLPAIWRRHVADSAQLVEFFPTARRWLDLGSGAGFPGIVIAIFMAEKLNGHVELIESKQRKCAFLHQAIRVTGAPATVHEGRIEAVLSEWHEPVDFVTARGLASLDRLFALVAPLVAAGARAAFHKGRDFEREIVEASKSWEFHLVRHQSLVETGGVILEVTRLVSKTIGA